MTRTASGPTPGPGKDFSQPFGPLVLLLRQILRRRMVATPEAIDGLLLLRQFACNGVELDPPFEGEAIDKLQMVETRAGSAPCPAPDLPRRRLSCGAGRNLPGSCNRYGA